MTGYVAFGNDELASRPSVKWGDPVFCPMCGAMHTLTNGEPEGSQNRNLLLTFKCGEKDYLGAIAGRLVVNAKSSSSGNI